MLQSPTIYWKIMDSMLHLQFWSVVTLIAFLLRKMLDTALLVNTLKMGLLILSLLGKERMILT
jgi:hypothetical protein